MDFKKWAKSNRLKVIGYRGMARQQIGYEY
jgi:hypothetical protein